MALFRSRELAIFYQQLGQLYKSGVSLTDSLPLAAAQTGDAGLRAAVADVRQRVLSGTALGGAFEANREVFSELQVALVAVGEENGMLDRNFFRLAEIYEKEYGARKKLVLGLAYPAFLLLAAFLLPRLSLWVTVSFEAYVRAVFFTMLPFIVVGAGLYFASTLFRTSFRPAFDRVQLELPVLGSNLRKLALARFGSTLATLYASGIEFRRAIRLALRALGNRFLEERCRIVPTYLDEGATLGEAFAATRVFPEEFVHAIVVGETTGNLDQVLDRLSRMYDEEAEKTLNLLLFFLPIVVYLLVAAYIAVIVIRSFAGYYGGIGNLAQ